MKLIGLDIGTKRIGVAKVDMDSVKIAVPYGTIDVDGTEFNQIASFSRVYGTEMFVLGLPRNSQGQETKQSEYVRDFAKKLKKAIPSAKVCFQDESLTSVEAEERLKSRKQNYEKGEIDAEAATIILQDFVENFSEQTITDQDKYAKKKTHSHKKLGFKILSVAIVIAILLVIFAAGSVIWYKQMVKPVGMECAATSAEANDTCESTAYIVADGATVSQIGDGLASAGLIKNSLAFQIYIRINHLTEQIKSGKYHLYPYQSVAEIVEELKTGGTSDNVFRLTILPGETIREVKARLIKVGYAQSDIDAAFSKQYDHPLLATKPANASLEGYLYGDTYEFYNDDTVETVLTRLFDELYSVVQDNDLENKFKAQGLTLHQGIILASIVQKEAHPADQATVAQVFYKRLKMGIMLGSDVTVKYAVDQVDPERKVYTDNAKALRINSCYNTRMNSGLPCGAISNPGKSALIATANPADTSYLYFLTGDDGKMYYGNTEAEHNQNIRVHCQVSCYASL